MEKNLEIKIPPFDQHRLGEFNITCPTLQFEDLLLIQRYYDPPHLGFHYDKRVFKVDDNTDIRGFFQSEKYFKNIEPVIRKEIVFKNGVVQKARKFLATLDTKTSIVSIHVRRGDYLTQQEKHPLPPLTYFKEAISFFPENFQFVVVSDDLRWCKKNFKGKNIFFCEGNTDIEDLAVMSFCHHNIIANSTFSWWGAWLNQNSKKQIIAPKKWFGPDYSHLSTKDLIPESWKRI